MAFFSFHNLRGDLLGGVTAGVVALPLALAFGEASGAGPIAGLYGAIFVGFFAALFGGTGSQISGPTGPMIVVFAGTYAGLSGNADYIFAAVILAGVLQILFGIFRLGEYIRLVPYPVVSGFMSGIGVIIIALQVSRLFGNEPEGSGTIPAIQAIPNAVLNPAFPALTVGLLSLAIVFFWPKKLGKYVPGALAALLIGTGVSLLLPAMPILGSIPTGLPDIIIPKISSDSAVIIFKAAVVLALLGTIDSLLTSLVADNMTRTRHNSNQELVGQGIGNAIAGLFGGIPGAGATMRTVVNIRSGGLTKISGMIHSLLLLAVVLVLAPLAEKIPHAVLAGILVKVGYDIIDWQYLSRAHRGPRWDLVLMVLVLGLTVFVDLITAVVAGVALAALAFTKQLADSQLKAFSEAPAQMTDPEEHRLMQAAKGKISLFEFSGPLSFGAAADAAHRVRGRLGGDVEVIILDFSRLPFLDISAARAVDSISGDAAEAGLAVYASGMNDAVKKTLKGLKADNHIPTDMRFSNRIDALREAVSDLSNPAEAAIT